MSLRQRIEEARGQRNTRPLETSLDNRPRGTALLQERTRRAKDLKQMLTARGEYIRVTTTQAQQVMDEVLALEFPGNGVSKYGLPLLVQADGLYCTEADEAKICKTFIDYGITLTPGQCFYFPDGFDRIFKAEFLVSKTYYDAKFADDVSESMY